MGDDKLVPCAGCGEPVHSEMVDVTDGEARCFNCVQQAPCADCGASTLAYADTGDGRVRCQPCLEAIFYKTDPEFRAAMDRIAAPDLPGDSLRIYPGPDDD